MQLLSVSRDHLKGHMTISRRAVSAFVLALALAAAFVPSALASTAAWKPCGSVSATVNEGLNRATAKIYAISQDGKSQLGCSTARSLTRRVLTYGPGERVRVGAHVWKMTNTNQSGRTVEFSYSRGAYAVNMRITSW